MKSSIGIIGGGFSGCLLAHHLLEKTADLQVVIFNKSSRIGPGLAYQPQSSKMLLNVKAGKMSAFPSLPTDFVDWLMEQNQFPLKTKAELSNSFVGRELYGQYLETRWKNTHQKYADRISIIAEEVLDVSKSDKEFIIQTKDTIFHTQYCVLATGNELPRNPTISNNSFYQSPNYFQNPWSIDCELIDDQKPILIIGTGLTMVDTVQLLREKKKCGTIYCISPHGFKILPQGDPENTFDGILTKMKIENRLDALLTQFNIAKKEISKNKGSLEPLINYFRPYTSSLWQGFTFEEKSFFLRHLRHKWGVARHRIPPLSYEQINNELLENKLIILAGIIKQFHEKPDGIDVVYTIPSTNKEATIHVASVINCTGPEADISKMEQGLLAKLHNSQLIQPDELKLGIQVSVNDFNIKNIHNTQNFYAIGNLLRGELWESTAINELREQAVQLSLQIEHAEKTKKNC
jgi:uncharacterized NAD(P)/FAD-binding protein YdhS